MKIIHLSLSLFLMHTHKRYRLLDEYPCEPFTDVYFLKYKNIDSARVAKRKLDNWNFYSHRLHICYAPEYETVEDTRSKIEQRRMIIAQKTSEHVVCMCLFIYIYIFTLCIFILSILYVFVYICKRL